MIIKKRYRKFTVGKDKDIDLYDKGSIYLNNNENISIHFNEKINYDVAKKNWGFYPIPSLNKRLKKFKLKPVIVKNLELETYFLMLVVDQQRKIIEFKNYCKKEKLNIITWLNQKNLEKIKKFFKN